ncbi:hypothetical protein BROUX41_006627 [Berkeleyomyces rouxiae]|uniref:uncharacterized protein n=1 Tax=Berkeleyomyces rouxiae TaxID=2035830 RepID=UPI003B7DDA7C
MPLQNVIDLEVSTTSESDSEDNGAVIDRLDTSSSAASNIDGLSERPSVQSGRRKRPLSPATPERVEWTDEDDILVQAPRQGRDSKKTRSSNSSRQHPCPSQTVPRGRGRQTTLTGKIHRDDKARHKKEPQTDGEAMNLPPDYVRTRRVSFDVRDIAGLRVPPDSDALVADIAARLTRPEFSATSGVRPCRLCSDVEIPASGGVIPASVAQYLRDYQLDGVRFLHRLFVWQIGGVLGDDMGLGKTVQVAAFLATAFGKTGDERDQHRMRRMRAHDAGGDKAPWYPRVLIICPASLVHNWCDELSRWGWWHVEVFHGSPAKKADVLQMARKGRLEIMITTYDTYSNNRSSINLVDWDAVIADECHRIKDRSSNTTQAMSELNALCRIGLTGTGIQNNYDELWALLNWTNPGRFGSLPQWQTAISRPLVVGQSHDATLSEILFARSTARRLVENVLPPFFLRRLKTLLADQLPRKRDRVVFCPLTPLQEQAYQSFLKSDMVQCIVNARRPCECGSSKAQGDCCHRKLHNGRTRASYIFPAMVALQKLSNHLALLLPKGSDAREKQNIELETLRDCLPGTWDEMYHARDAIKTLANPEFCGKWKILKELLRMWYADGDKVLVFSHSVRLLNILHHLLTNTSYTVSYLDGSLSYDERSRTVADFNADPHQFVFLISTRAGGVGLNITSANRVVIIDPHWNPALDLQAQDRAYRIGQTRDVDVYRLVAAGTVEELVYARQIYKQQQANIGYSASTEPRYFKGVQHDDGRKGEIFGLENIFSYRKDRIVLKDIVHNTNVAEAKVHLNLNLMDIDVEQVAVDAENTLKVEGLGTSADSDGSMGIVSGIFAGQSALKNSRTVKPRADSTTTPKPKADPIDALLRAAGVAYTHENTAIIGPSHIEDKLSRAPGHSTEAHARRHTSKLASLNDVAAAQAELAYPLRAHYKYNPPDDVLTRQFCEMARTLGFADATAFALVVENGTVEQRRGFLKVFYEKRREILFGEQRERGVKEELGEHDVKTEYVKDEEVKQESMKEEIDMDFFPVKKEEPLGNSVMTTPAASLSATEPVNQDLNMQSSGEHQAEPVFISEDEL